MTDPLPAETLRDIREMANDSPPYMRIRRETVLRLVDELERLRAENEQLRQDISYLRPDR